MPYFTAIATLLVVALYFVLATQVAAARGKFDVKLPATTGNPQFERIFRAHINTLEWMPTFLVPLWLCAIYLSDAQPRCSRWSGSAGESCISSAIAKRWKSACPASSFNQQHACCCLSAPSRAS